MYKVTLEQEIWMRRQAKLRKLAGEPESPVILNYDLMRIGASFLAGYVKVKVDVNSALGLADKCAYPDSVRLAVMKQVANAREITLEQLRVILGWSARRAQARR